MKTEQYDITEVSSWHTVRNAIHLSFFDVNNWFTVTFDSYVNCVNVLLACLFLFLDLTVFILLSFDE